MIGLETARLKFRQWQEDDLEILTDYFSDENKTKFIGGKKSREETWRLMATYIGHYHLKGFGYVAVVEKTSNKLVGSVGLWNSDAWPELELGYWLLSDMQGNGYAREAAERVRDYAFESLQVETLVSYISPKNEPSKRLAAKLGAVYDSDIELLNFGLHCVYRYDLKNIRKK